MILTVVGPELPTGLVSVPGSADVSPPAEKGVPLPVAGPSDPLPPTGDGFHWLCIGARSPRADAPDRAAYAALAAMLGSSSASLLYRTVRTEHGLSYSFHAWDHGYREAGAWRILLGTDTASVGRVRDLVCGLLTDIAAGRFSEADFGAARRHALMRLVTDRDNPIEHARLLAELECTRPGHTLDDESVAIDQVTVESLMTAAGRVLADLVFVHRP
ncbi:insulinase family protein [Streptomyces asiaticus]